MAELEDEALLEASVELGEGVLEAAVEEIALDEMAVFEGLGVPLGVGVVELEDETLLEAGVGLREGVLEIAVEEAALDEMAVVEGLGVPLGVGVVEEL